MSARSRAEVVATAQINRVIGRGKPTYQHPAFPTREAFVDAIRPGDTIADERTGAPLAVIAVERAEGARWLYTRDADDLDGTPTRKLRFSPDAVIRRAVHPGPERTTS